MSIVRQLTTIRYCSEEQTQYGSFVILIIPSLGPQSNKTPYYLLPSFLLRSNID